MQPVFLALLSVIGSSLLLTSASAESLSTIGTPGLIDMPTARVLGDGEIALTTNRFGETGRSTFTFQVLPRVYGTFRYSTIRGFDGGGSLNRYDRSFDLHYQVLDETEGRPALAFGLRDFGGTGVLSSEYIAATKNIGDKFTMTGGLGWGRLAQRGSFDNPLAVLSDRFEMRPDLNEGGISTTGQLDFGAWLRGPVALFGGVDYQATDRLSFQIEYSTDAYDKEVTNEVIKIESPINIGLNYSYPSGSNIKAFVIGGTTVGLQYSFTFDPARRLSPGGLDEAPLPIPLRDDAILASWNLSDPATQDRAQGLLHRLLEVEGITLDGVSTSGSTVTVRIQNRRFEAWLSRARSQIADAPQPITRAGELEGAFPKLSYGLSAYTSFSFFDPDQPVRFETGPQLTVGYSPSPGLSFDGQFRYPLYSNMDNATRRSNSVLPRVRSDAILYAIESEFEINRLTAEYMFRPAPDMFARVTVGFLEEMYAGISTEALWYPIDSKLALGLEVNYAVQRDFNMLFGLQDYDVITGHASAYYDFDYGFAGQLDIGRYLAGDWGATFAVDREFNNGFKVGAYFTLTDVSFDDFGEGSFDKGIRITVPQSWLTGQSTRTTLARTIQPVLRDGGARLNVPNRLYNVNHDYRANNLGDGWGRIFR